MIISVCGPVGFETAERLYDEHREELEERFASFFLRQFEEIAGETVSKSFCADGGIVYCSEITDGGIYRALWEAGEAIGCGMRINNSAIPIRQETIEILELYGETPYECSSKGSWLFVTEEEIYEVSSGGKNIPVFMIGETTDGNARVLEDGENIRFLTPPGRQERDIEDRIRGGMKNR